MIPKTEEEMVMAGIRNGPANAGHVYIQRYPRAPKKRGRGQRERCILYNAGGLILARKCQARRGASRDIW